MKHSSLYGLDAQANCKPRRDYHVPMKEADEKWSLGPQLYNLGIAQLLLS